jgi:hypothetical protein
MKQATGKTTGKDALDFSLMQAAAEAGLQAAKALFMVSYLLLCWNIMARTNNISSIVFQHLNWVNDCLEVDCFITKSDQAAKKANQKHVYANPLNPIICPILALAMYLLDRPDAGTNNNCIYPGTAKKGNKSESSKFLKGLGSLLTLAATLLMVPIAIARYGAHSLRKGGVSFAAGGSTMAPSVIAIILRAGWAIKGVESRYFRFQNAMDQFLGRVMAGLPLDSGDFAVLPPFFVKKTAEEGVFLKEGKTQQSSSPCLLAGMGRCLGTGRCIPTTTHTASPWNEPKKIRRLATEHNGTCSLTLPSLFYFILVHSCSPFCKQQFVKSSQPLWWTRPMKKYWKCCWPV